MTKANQEPSRMVTDPATPKQIAYIYRAYLQAGLTDTSKLTDIANKFIHPDMHVNHWMDINFTTASHWIDAIAKAQANKARKDQAKRFDPDRFA